MKIMMRSSVLRSVLPLTNESGSLNRPCLKYLATDDDSIAADAIQYANLLQSPWIDLN
jgi:hypothetical protein